MTKIFFSILISAFFAVLSPAWADLPPFKDPFAPAASHSKSEPVICTARVYVNVSSTLVSLKTQPADNAENTAQLRNRQYLCVIQDDEQEDGWLEVKAVPFTNGKNTLCDASKKNPGCGQMGNFPVVWPAGKEQSTKNCRLTTRYDSEGEPIISPKGNCATGWLRRHQVKYFAD